MPPGGAVFGFQPYKSTEKQLCAFSAVKTFVASVNKQHCIQHEVAPRIRKAGQRGANKHAHKPQCVCQRWWNQLQAFCSGSAHTGEGCAASTPLFDTEASRWTFTDCGRDSCFWHSSWWRHINSFLNDPSFSFGPQRFVPTSFSHSDWSAQSQYRCCPGLDRWSGDRLRTCGL